MAQLPKLKPGFNLFSKDQDVQLGREAAAQIEQQVPVVRDSQLQNYVTEIGRRLASQPQADKYPYTFKVVNDQSINAFALPGGPTYVHSGLIRAAENEAQLAGVIAHEIAHVALRHGTNQASKANLIQLPAMIAGSVLGGGGSMLGQLAQLGIGLGANSVLLKFSRDAERDADALGAQLLAGAGWNPMEMARFFEKLAAQGGSRGPQFLSDHPDPGDRMQAVQKIIPYLPRQNYATNLTGDFQQAQSRVGSLPASSGTRARLDQGGAQGNPGSIRPTGRMRQFNGRAFSMAHPENWEVFGGNDNASVTIAPREALAQSGNGGVQIGYGAMVSYYFPGNNNGRANLRQDTQALIRDLQRTNPGLETGGSQRQVRVDGQPGLVTQLHSISPYQGETEHDFLLTVSRPEGLFYVVFITPARASRELQPVFESMLSSIRFSR